MIGFVNNQPLACNLPRLMTVAMLGIVLMGVSSMGSAEEARPYDEHIRCTTDTCTIDIFLTRGYRAFSQCQVCHGLDGTGSTIAPSLLDKLGDLDQTEFAKVVAEGKTGQIGVMPPWKDNPNVMKYIDNLYLYLLARSDDKIPAGSLQRFDR